MISLAVINSISKQKIMHSTHVGAAKLESTVSLEVLTENKFFLVNNSFLLTEVLTQKVL